MIRIMHLTRSYHWSNESLEWIVEDGGLGNLAAACDREENASHHFSSFFTWGTPYCMGRGVRSTLLPVHHENHAKIMKNEIAQKSSGIIPDDSGTLQSISRDSLVSPKVSWIDFTNIDFFVFFMIFWKLIGISRIALVFEIWG